MLQNTFDYKSIELGNDLMPSGHKPLPKRMLANICVAIWRKYATMSWYDEIDCR